MLLHDWAVLRENWEVGLRPSHPHQLSGLGRSPVAEAALPLKSAHRPRDHLMAWTMKTEPRRPLGAVLILHLAEQEQGPAGSRSPSVRTPPPHKNVRIIVRALTLQEAAGSLKEPGLWRRAGGRGKSPGTWFLVVGPGGGVL